MNKKRIRIFVDLDEECIYRCFKPMSDSFEMMKIYADNNFNKIIYL